MRKIIHVDMDAFYASVEQRDDPALRGLPVVVGGSPEGRAGVVATASYEARRFGIRSAMPSKKAKQLCPQAIFVYPRFAVYKEVSRHIREIFHRYTDLVQPLSLDEAYLDVTEDKLGIGSAIEIAKAIKQAIQDELNLTASAGVSVNKFVAKVASGMNKPDGLTFIGPSAIEQFMEQLPVEEFYGVGKVTAGRMKQLGLHTGADLKALAEDELIRHFGKAGRFYYQIVRGIDDRPVKPDRDTKSVGAEDTFPEDLTLHAQMFEQLKRIAGIVTARMQRYQLRGRTITVKIRYGDFTLNTRSRSLPIFVDDPKEIARVACELVEGSVTEGSRIRLLGISVSKFLQAETAETKGASVQLSLF